LITTSGLGERPMAGTITYSACKSFAGFIGEGLNFELKGKVDVINYQAGEVTTKMLRRFKTDSRTITPDRAAKTSLRDLGLEIKTNGSFRHEFWMGVINRLPLGVV
jgi:short-subunit dehydrogenase